MQLSVTNLLTIPEHIVYFDYLETGLDLGGLRIKAKSRLFADWIKDCQVEKDNGAVVYRDMETPGWQGIEPNGPRDFYCPVSRWRNGEYPHGSVAYPCENLFYDGKPNLFWLFNTKLGEGCDILLKMPVSMNNWEDYHSACLTAIDDIYVGELRKATILSKFVEVGPVVLRG